MNPLLEAANALLEDVGASITGKRRLPTPVVHDLLDEADELVAQARLEARDERHDYIVARGKVMIEEELPILENLRRLLAYGRSCGSRAGIDHAASNELLDLLEAAPRFDRTKGIKSLADTSEWLQSNRPRIKTLLSKLNTQTNPTR